MNHPCHIRSVCATAILLAGCGGDRAADRHEPLVDTLRSGTVVVQNSPQGLWDLDPGARWTVVESVRIGSSDGIRGRRAPSGAPKHEGRACGNAYCFDHGDEHLRDRHR